MTLHYELSSQYALLSSVAQACSIKGQGVYSPESSESYFDTSEQLTEDKTG